MITAYFIGGSKDGEVITLEAPSPYYHLPMINQVTHFNILSLEPFETEVQTEVYKMEKFGFKRMYEEPLANPIYILRPEYTVGQETYDMLIKHRVEKILEEVYEQIPF